MARLNVVIRCVRVEIIQTTLQIYLHSNLSFGRWGWVPGRPPLIVGLLGMHYNLPWVKHMPSLPNLGLKVLNDLSIVHDLLYQVFCLKDILHSRMMREGMGVPPSGMSSTLGT
jgi:hypothetical protein